MKNQEDSNRIAICLVVNESDNVLMGQRVDTKKFTVPCGHILVGEDIFEGAVRELFEETGLDAQAIELVHAEFNKKKNKLLYLFEIQVDTSQTININEDPDKEFIAAAFIDPNGVKDELSIPLAENIALKYWANN